MFCLVYATCYEYYYCMLVFYLSYDLTIDEDGWTVAADDGGSY